MYFENFHRPERSLTAIADFLPRYYDPLPAGAVTPIHLKLRYSLLFNQSDYSEQSELIARRVGWEIGFIRGPVASAGLVFCLGVAYQVLFIPSNHFSAVALAYPSLFVGL